MLGSSVRAMTAPGGIAALAHVLRLLGPAWPSWPLGHLHGPALHAAADNMETKYYSCSLPPGNPTVYGLPPTLPGPSWCRPLTPPLLTDFLALPSSGRRDRRIFSRLCCQPALHSPPTDRNGRPPTHSKGVPGQQWASVQ
jgi:hypothetical protein